jgi:hypothetical protein
MKILTTLIFIAALITAANAEPIKLQDFSIKDVESRCLKVHGEFISHDDGSYGCTYFKGTIKCNAEQHCTGVLKEVPHHKASPPKKRHIHPYYHGYRHWYPYQQW